MKNEREDKVILSTLLTMGIIRYWPGHPAKAETIRGVAKKATHQVSGKNLILLRRVVNMVDSESLFNFIDTAAERLQQGGHLNVTSPK